MTESPGGELLECEWCGAKFERPHGFGPRPRTCSIVHRRVLAATRRALADVGTQHMMSEIAASSEFTAMMRNVTAAATAGVRELKLFSANAESNWSGRVSERAGASGFAESLKRLNLPAHGAAAVAIGSMMETLRKTMPKMISTDMTNRFAARHQNELRELLTSMTPTFRFNDYVTWMTKASRVDTPLWADALRREGGALTEMLRSVAPAVDEALEPIYDKWVYAAKAREADTSGDVTVVAPALLLMAMMGQLLMVLDDRVPEIAAWLWACLGVIDDIVGRVAIGHGVWTAVGRQPIEAADEQCDRPT